MPHLPCAPSLNPVLRALVGTLGASKHEVQYNLGFSFSWHWHPNFESMHARWPSSAPVIVMATLLPVHLTQLKAD